MYKTERLFLRPSRPQDASAVCSAISDTEIVRNLGSAPWPYTMVDAENFVDKAFDPSQPRLLAFDSALPNQHLLGVAGLDRMPCGAIELGYWIAKPYWGCGFASELGRKMIDIAKDELSLKRLNAGYFIDNPASGRVLSKLGFSTSGDPVYRHSRGRDTTALCQMCVLDL